MGYVTNHMESECVQNMCDTHEMAVLKGNMMINIRFGGTLYVQAFVYIYIYICMHAYIQVR